MAKKNFGGLSSLITGNIQPDEPKQENTPFLAFTAKKKSENMKLKDNKGYYRKTFLMDADLGRMVEIWAGYNKIKDKSFSEKNIADEALRDYFSKVDHNELQKALNLFGEK